jgi:hypothetical protein
MLSDAGKNKKLQFFQFLNTFPPDDFSISSGLGSPEYHILPPLLARAFNPF